MPNWIKRLIHGTPAPQPTALPLTSRRLFDEYNQLERRKQEIRHQLADMGYHISKVGELIAYQHMSSDHLLNTAGLLVRVTAEHRPTAGPHYIKASLESNPTWRAIAHEVQRRNLYDRLPSQCVPYLPNPNPRPLPAPTSDERELLKKLNNSTLTFSE